jgi:hypothetical protein
VQRGHAIDLSSVDIRLSRDQGAHAVAISFLSRIRNRRVGRKRLQTSGQKS